MSIRANPNAAEHPVAAGLPARRTGPSDLGDHRQMPIVYLRTALAAGGVALWAQLAACAGPPPATTQPGPERPHHRAHGFQNNHIDFTPKGLTTLLKWRALALRDGLPPPPAKPTPVVAPDLGFISANARAGAAMQPAVTWIGHATVLAQLGGLNVLTDPIFSERASPLAFIGPKRAQPPGLTLAQLPHIDVVVISHNHYDHLDAASVKALAQQSGGSPLFLVPLGNKLWMSEQGIERVVEMDWWQRERVGAVEIVFTPVQHWSGRHLNDRMRTLWGGFAVLAPELRLFHAGDTGYSPDFAEIGARLGDFDLALIPVGAYEPRWFMREQHVNPPEAVAMHRDLRARRSLGMHWGTFALTDESLDEPPLKLAEARRAAGIGEDEFFLLAIGQTRTLARREPPVWR
jgi:N-acyl-phosphatidylethanolamine-hydrolysing phospholipase D